MKKKIFNIKLFLYLIITLSIAVNYNFFLNTFALTKHDYSERLDYIYGNCEKEGFGFTKLIFQKYDLKYNISSINGEDKNYASIMGLFYDKSKIFNKDYIILINYKNKIHLEFPDFEILEQKENCYFIKKKNYG